MSRGLAIVEVSAPATGVPTVRLGSSVEPEEAWTLGRGRADVPGTGHTEDQTLDASLRTAPLRSMTGAACAALFKGRPTAAGERFDKRMRCPIDADGVEGSARSGHVLVCRVPGYKPQPGTAVA